MNLNVEPSEFLLRVLWLKQMHWSDGPFCSHAFSGPWAEARGAGDRKHGRVKFPLAFINEGGERCPLHWMLALRSALWAVATLPTVQMRMQP